MADRIDHCALALSSGDSAAASVIRKQLKELHEYAKEISNGSEQTYKNILNRIIDDAAFSADAEVGRVRAINNLIKRKEAVTAFRRLYPNGGQKEFGFFLDNYGHFAAESQVRGVSNGLSAWMRQTKFSGDGGQETSVYTYYQANKNKRQSQVNFAKEMQAIAAGKPIGETGDMGAALIAKKISDMRAVNREAMRRAGVDIRMRDDYQGKQTLSQHKVVSVDPDDFVNAMIDKLDWETMFDGAALTESQKRKILSDIHDSIVNGEASIYGKGMYLDGGDIDTRSVGKRYEQSRQLVYKDIESYMDAMELYGEGGNVFENSMVDLGKLARDAAVIDRFGADAAQNYKAIRAEVGIQQPTGLFNVDSIFKNITGEADLIGSTTSSYQAAKIAGGVRNVISSATMGQIFFAALPDAAVQSSIIKKAIGKGQPVIKSVTNILSRIKDDEGRQIFAQYADAYSSQLIGGLNTGMGRYGDIFEGGVTAWLAKNVYHFGGMSLHEAGGKQGAVAAVARAHHAMAGKSFSEVNSMGLYTRLRMDQFGINEKMWNFYKSRDAVIDAEGNKYLTTDALKQAPDSVIAQEYIGDALASKSMIEAARREMVLAFESYYTKIASNAVLTPTARDRSIQNFGYKRGTLPGEALRSTMHLTTFPIMVMNNVVLPMVGNKDFSMLAVYAAQATALGYISMVARDALAQRYRDYTTDDPAMQAAMWTEAFARGGAGGIVFDLLYQMAQFGQDPTGRFGGMSFGAMQDAFKVMMDAHGAAMAMVGDDDFDEKFQKLLSNTARTTRRYIPFGSLPVIQQTLDNLVYFPLQNAIDTDTMERVRDNWENRTGGGYWL